MVVAVVSAVVVAETGSFFVFGVETGLAASALVETTGCTAAVAVAESPNGEAFVAVVVVAAAAVVAVAAVVVAEATAELATGEDVVDSTAAVEASSAGDYY